MSRFLLLALFATAAFSCGTHLVRADDAEPSDAPKEAAAPAAKPADAEKGAEATEDTASPKPAENKDSAESSGEEKATDDSAADPASPKTEAAPESKPEDASSEDAKPTETKPALTEDSTEKTGSAGNETAPTNEKLEPWQELHQQWLVVDKKLREAELKYYHSPKAEQFELRGAFEKLIETEAIPLLAELRAEVMKAYAAKPNENVEVVRLLIGFMVNHARMQEVAEAKEIVELLIDNKCDEKYVMVASRMPGLRPSSLEILEQLEKRYKDALSAKDSSTDPDATPDSGDSFSPANENPDASTDTTTEDKGENPSPGKTDPE